MTAGERSVTGPPACLVQPLSSSAACSSQARRSRPLGRALAVVEMLVGQLYLVTVIGVLVGSLAQRRTA
jgi:hypothetical protein